MRVDEGVFDVLVSKDSHDMKKVFGLMIFHSRFKMSKCQEGYPQDSWVFQFLSYSFPLSLKDSLLSFKLCATEDFLGFSR